MKITEYRNKHMNEDIYVLGSGKTMNYYSPDFFQGRTTVAANYGWSRILPRVDYMVTKYHAHANDWLGNPNAGVLVTTRGERGHRDLQPTENEHMVIADHNENTVEKWEPSQWPKNANALVATHSTITTAMHWAAYLGARNIFLVGTDCGTLDNQTNVEGYPRNQTDALMLRSYDMQNRMVRDELTRRYNCNIVSLSPFTSPNMDGHKYASHAGHLNVT